MRSNLIIAIGFAALVSVFPALAAVPAHPGTLNYLEGDVSVDGRTIAGSSVGSSDLVPGAVLRTGAGKAEVLLTPGVFLRVGSNSEVRMIASGLTDTRVAVQSGAAMIEATDVHKENRIQVNDAGTVTTIEKKGLYRFDATQPSVQVFDGKAEVRQDDQTVELKKGKAVTPGNAALVVEKFDRDEAQKDDDLYKWSKLRSGYISEASAAMAQRIYVKPNTWYGPGWYWNPFWSSYAWLPGNALYSPFGYGFYSPWYSGPAYVVPRYRGGWHRGGRPILRPGQTAAPATRGTTMTPLGRMHSGTAGRGGRR